VIAGKVIDAEGNQSRFTFARNNPAVASGAIRQALSVLSRTESFCFGTYVKMPGAG
jgi:hypothetical protein